MKRPCAVPGCERQSHFINLCANHYQQYHRNGGNFSSLVAQADRPPGDRDDCGFGTDYGCGQAIYANAHCITNARGPVLGETEHTIYSVLYHQQCCPCVTAPPGTVHSVFRERLAAELGFVIGPDTYIVSM